MHRYSKSCKLRGGEKKKKKVLYPLIQHRALKYFKCLPVFNEDISGNRVYVRVKCGHTAAHKYSEPHVIPNSDRGFEADEIPEVKHVRASFILPVICTQHNSSKNRHDKKKKHNARGEQNSLVIILKLNSKVSTAAWVDMKGIQVGRSEELDKLYFLRKVFFF